MAIIPRYRPQGGPSVRGLDYAGAYSPPEGSDWRLLARAAQVVGSVAGSMGSIGGGGSEGGAADPETAAAMLEAREADAAYRDSVGQLMETSDGVDPAGLDQAWTSVAGGLSATARTAFEALSAPRRESFHIEAQARANDRQVERARAAALGRERLGVEEYLRQADIDEGLARGALASAVAQRGERLRADGADEAGVLAGRRALLSETQAARVGRRIATDPAAARVMLETGPAVIDPAARERLEGEIRAAALRREAHSVASDLVRREPQPPTLDSLMAAVAAHAGDNPERQVAFQTAGAAALRARQAEIEAREAAAWAEATKHWVGTTSDLPEAVWIELSPRQRGAATAHLAAPYRRSDPEVVAWLKDLAARAPEQFSDLDLGTLHSDLSLSDHAEWRALQEQARRDGPSWRSARARLSRISSQIDGLDNLLGGASRAARYEAVARAEILKGAPLSNEELIEACRSVVSDEDSELRWPSNGAPPRRGFGSATTARDLLKPGYERPLRNPNLGALSKRYEIGERDGGHITTVARDPGLASYGLYQFTTAFGVARDFAVSSEARPWRGLFGADPVAGSPAFNQAWRAAARADLAAFEAAQHNFFDRIAYRPFIERLESQSFAEEIGAESRLDFTNISYALQDVLWSTRVHQGQGGAQTILRVALAKSDYISKRKAFEALKANKLLDPGYLRAERRKVEADLIDAIYAERGRRDAAGRMVYFQDAGPEFWEGLERRFKEENVEAKFALEKEEPRQ